MFRCPSHIASFEHAVADCVVGGPHVPVPPGLDLKLATITAWICTSAMQGVPRPQLATCKPPPPQPDVATQVIGSKSTSDLSEALCPDDLVWGVDA